MLTERQATGLSPADPLREVLAMHSPSPPHGARAYDAGAATLVKTLAPGPRVAAAGSVQRQAHPACRKARFIVWMKLQPPASATSASGRCRRSLRHLRRKPRKLSCARRSTPAAFSARQHHGSGRPAVLAHRPGLLGTQGASAAVRHLSARAGPAHFQHTPSPGRCAPTSYGHAGNPQSTAARAERRRAVSGKSMRQRLTGGCLRLASAC